MPTIKYDRPVQNFIAGLNATGHVTHTRHRKTSVTFHHNGGRLSLKGILEVWKSRPASAHFQVVNALVGQYVNVNEYAWATGSTKGNQESISIEMSNSTTAPEWRVSEATWHNACRLAAWLHWKVIGHRPTASSVKFHKDWKSTACPGPYMSKLRGQVLSLTQWWYDELTGKHPKKKTTAPETKVPGRPKAPAKSAPTRPVRKSVAQLAGEVLAGQWSTGAERKRRLEAAGYDYEAVQNAVNARMRGGAPTAHRASIAEVAQQVIDGDWGNGTERKRRLENAGYNYREVQDVVNRLV